VPDRLVCRYVEPIPIGAVPRILSGESRPETESVDDGVDAVAYENLVDAADAACIEEGGGIARDGELAELIHLALSGLTRRELTDPRLWQWLTTVPFHRYVIARWASECELDPWAAAKSSIHQRFCGAGSIAGIARNALGRLFWVAEATSTNGDYELTRRAFTSQDLVVGVFERRLGLEPRLARACIENLVGETELVRRTTLVILNYSLSTVVVEVLSDPEVDELINDSLEMAKGIAGNNRTIDSQD